MKTHTFFTRYYAHPSQGVADLLTTGIAASLAGLTQHPLVWVTGGLAGILYWVIRFSGLSLNGRHYFLGLLASVVFLTVAYVLQPLGLSLTVLFLALPVLIFQQNKITLLAATATMMLYVGVSYAYPQLGNWLLTGMTPLTLLSLAAYMGLLVLIVWMFENQLKNTQLLHTQLTTATEQIALNIMSAREIASGVYHEETQLATDELGKTLQAMGISIRNVQQEDERRRWHIESLQELSEVIRSSTDDDLLPSRLMKSLIKSLDAQQGGLYIADLNTQDPSFQKLTLKGSYAYNQEKLEAPTVEAGEGLLGQAYLAKEIIHLHKLPANYLTLASGLGEAAPSTLVIVPIMLEEQVVGVFEIASLKTLQNYQIEFLQKASQIIASAILSSRTNEQIRRLLRESQEVTEELQAHEEEMRQNIEELSAMQENLERAHAEINKSRDFLNLVMDNINDPLFVKNRKHEFIMVNAEYCQFMGYTREMLLSKTALDIFGVEKGQRFVNEEEQLFIHRQPSIIEDEITTVGKGTKTYLKRKVVVEDAEGNLYLVGLLTDITEMANLRKRVSV